MLEETTENVFAKACAKLTPDEMTYVGINNNMRVFQIERKIKDVAQKVRSVQKYTANL
jgi:hypothetical protein